MADHLEELPWVKSGYLLTYLPCHPPLTAPGNDLSAEDRRGAEEDGNAVGSLCKSPAALRQGDFPKWNQQAPSICTVCWKERTETATKGPA